MTTSFTNHRPSDIPTIPKPMVDRPTHPSVLHQVLKQARLLGEKGIVAFDLDATLFTNYPRWVRILKEYGQAKNLPVLLECKEEFINGFSMYLSMVQSGIPADIAKKIEPDAYAFWAERFYSSSYCVEDKPLPGAVNYLHQILNTQIQIAYVTGRHQGMVEGTIACMKREEMPIPDSIKIHILAKPQFEMTDDAWKETAYAKLRQLGELVAAFDNEPTHINSYHLAFPKAQAVHLLTNDSGRGVTVLPEIPSIKNFILP